MRKVLSNTYLTFVLGFVFLFHDFLVQITVRSLYRREDSLIGIPSLRRYCRALALIVIVAVFSCGTSDQLFAQQSESIQPQWRPAGSTRAGSQGSSSQPSALKIKDVTSSTQPRAGSVQNMRITQERNLQENQPVQYLASPADENDAGENRGDTESGRSAPITNDSLPALPELNENLIQAPSSASRRVATAPQQSINASRSIEPWQVANPQPQPYSRQHHSYSTQQFQSTQQRFAQSQLADPSDISESLPSATPPNSILKPQRQASRQVPTQAPYQQSFEQEPYDPRMGEPQHFEQGAQGEFEETGWLPRIFRSSTYGRYTGQGEPLTAGSWLNRPYWISGFIGAISGDTLIAGHVNQNTGILWGARLGWDYDHYWGVETRLAFARQGLDFIDSPGSDNFSNDLVLWDASLIYYPWGDSRWRPYMQLGFGIADYDYTDPTLGIRRSDGVFSMPFGGGFKYRVNQYMTWRIDVMDNLIFGGSAGFETQNQFSANLGLEFRFGGARRSYFPWNPSMYWR